jgi:hypothetical protein
MNKFFVNIGIKAYDKKIHKTALGGDSKSGKTTVFL